MSTYSLADLLRLWSLGELTPEPVIGHLLQALLALTQRLAELETRLRKLEQVLNIPS